VVPEAGDEVQTMKAGLMEIANVFVVNKADRPEADVFVKNLRQMLAPAFNTQQHEIKVIKTVASQKSGTGELYQAISEYLQQQYVNTKKTWLLAEKAYLLIQQQKMKYLTKQDLKKALENEMQETGFNVYRFIKKYL
jgi:LAO/AO transport system kinase